MDWPIGAGKRKGEQGRPETDSREGARLSTLDKPLAIAMWDYSWLLKHHRYGAFADWDACLSGLVERGYDAIRMDCFPHLIAADREGKVQEGFLHKKTRPGKELWGLDYSIKTTPRASLTSFLALCRKHQVHVGLATWFMEQGTGRTQIFRSEDDFVRAWDETLGFIDQQGLMDIVCYVDLLNEYPLWHGFEWLQEQLNQRGNARIFEKNNPDANVPNELFTKKGRFNALQTRFYQEFMNRCLQRLRARWPKLDIFACETGGSVAQDYRHHAATGKKLGIPVGNTEGWGAVFWDDHPSIDWTFIRQAAELAVPLALEHGYRFVCTSNFCEPQFEGMWEDIAWHQKMTTLIKAGT